MSEPIGNGDRPKQRKEYTLPGIMQYLQSQFTLAERNRMQSDLERSSLKLKIVELESERNSLKLRNEKLSLQVEKLKEKLSKYEGDKNSELSRSASGKLLRSISIGRKHEKESSEKQNDLKDLAEVNTIDLKKLLEARKFLKSATSEIMYLLKSPNVVMEDPLQLNKRSFFDSTDPSTEIASPLTNGNSLVSSPQNEDYFDMEIPLDKASVRAKNHTQFKDDASTSDAETSTIIEQAIGESGKVHTIKPFKVMKRNKDVNDKVARDKKLRMPNTPAYGKLIGGKLYCFDKVIKTIQCYFDIENQPDNSLVDQTYLCSEDFVGLIDIKANSSFLVVAGERKVIVFSNSTSERDLKPLFIYENLDEDLKSIDLNKNDEVLLAFGNTVRTLKISKQNSSFIPVRSSDYKSKGEVLCARFTIYKEQFDFVVLTTTALILESVESSDSMTENATPSRKSQTISISSFDHYMLTSKNLAVNLEQGLFLIEFSNLTAFNHVPLLTPLNQDGYLGYAEDDGSLFYSLGSQNVLEIFKVISTGDILSLKNISIKNSGLLWCTIGNNGDGIIVCIADKSGISVKTL